MQYNDDGTRNRVVRLDRTQRSLRAKAHPAEQHANEVSRCVLSPEREAQRPSFNPNYTPSAEDLIGLLPDTEVTGIKVDDVCRKTLFLANLIGSPYVRLQ